MAADINIFENDQPSRLAPETLVVVPVYNEATNVLNLINSLLALPILVDILIVDDNSPDGTGRLVQSHPKYNQGVFLLSRQGRRGFALACRDGFQWGIRHSYAVCVEMDADFSHDPADLPHLLKALEEGADIALGSRYVDGIRVINWPARRLLLSLFAGFYTRYISGLPLCDPTSGFKAIRSRVLQHIDWAQFTADGYGFIIELHFYAHRKGFQITEVPIVFTERRRGASKMSYKIMVESALRVIRLGCYRLAHRKSKTTVARMESMRYA